MQGMPLNNHSDAGPSYIADGEPGRSGGGTYTGQSVEPTLEAYENIFGPSARDIKQDLQRFKRHGRWHLPDILKGPNQYLTDRVDGLITDATNSPFTSRILPYKYITNVDGKIKWNVWSFDEGLSSRVPYESAARTLQQSKQSYSGYTVRQGMAIVLEHNFMMTDAGRTNFKNQLNQLIGSIQLTNDLDVHVALVLAPSYQKKMKERYLTNDKSATQVCREFVDMFGFVQKNQNALDILIEEAKAQLKTWGAPMPDFMLCNSKLTFQLTMTPDVTNYITNGAEGQKRLKTGPDIPSYRGIGIVHTRAFSMETGAPPRDILRRRVRVAEYYRILPHKDNHKRHFQLYNEERDTWSTFTFQDLVQKAVCDNSRHAPLNTTQPGANNEESIAVLANMLGAAAGGLSRSAVAPSLTAHATGMALGRHLQVDGSDHALSANLTQLYKHIFSRDVKTEFSYGVTFLDKKVVYVPGAVDFSKGGLYDDVTDLNRAAHYPEFIRSALSATDTSKWFDTDKERAFFQIQSVALYPRNVVSFAQDIQRNALYDDFAWPAHFVQFPARGEANHNNAYDGLRISMAIRNFNRYGIPTEAIRGEPGDGKNTYDDALKLDIDRSRIHDLDQYLRNRGAFYCPNHYKRGNASNLTNLGDLLGYNTVMTRDFAIALTKQADTAFNGNNTDQSWSISSFLYDIVFNSSQYKALLSATANELSNIQQEMIQVESRSGVVDRIWLANRLIPKITAVLAKHNKAGHQPDTARTYNGDSKIEQDSAFYWLWSHTKSSTDEVHSTSNTLDHAKTVRGFRSFINDPDVTDNLIVDLDASADLNRGNDIFAFTAPVPLTDGLKAAVPTEATALNFFHMLAWRMWSDQELQLSRVYNPLTGSWPSVSKYLFPGGDYTYSHFGQGVMKYDEPQADWSAHARGISVAESQVSSATENVEIVIVRPNIEHYMLGIILGQGGESLGSTFWGQTELSCYDDSMYGIWGMSYKYNERAIVINERNLVRLWDIAYDGYVGGKEDSAVLWNVDGHENPCSVHRFNEATMDVTRPYRGPSMMVMAFNHGQAREHGAFVEDTYKRHFKSNWPSPIVFYDRMSDQDDMQLSADFDNIHNVEADQFRVFNNTLYQNAYAPYQKKMPDFYELHKIRKNAGLSSTENEASSEALAFQGTMRTLSADNGAVIQEILGSGHHGPDFIGCASLRAGKGYKMNSQPTMQRLI